MCWVSRYCYDEYSATLISGIRRSNQATWVAWGARGGGGVSIQGCHALCNMNLQANLHAMA